MLGKDSHGDGHSGHQYLAVASTRILIRREAWRGGYFVRDRDIQDSLRSISWLSSPVSMPCVMHHNAAKQKQPVPRNMCVAQVQF
jgi:hypothetical protein